MVEPLKRLDEVESLIREELYFTIHAPRQTGKTTYLYAMARKLNADANHIALVVSFEQAGYSGITVEKANELLAHNIYESAFEQLPGKYLPVNPQKEKFFNINDYLKAWSRSQTLPIVLFIDEIDVLTNSVLISVLRQFREGYQVRPKHFPASIVLVGLRDVREYKAEIREGMPSLGTASPFNVKSDSLFLKNFSKEEVFELLEQHTQETGQVFPAEVKEEVFRLTNGQPWLTNALARQMIAKILKYDFSQKITMELLMQAKQQLIMRRDTHLDSLVDRLREDRVKQILHAIINGNNLHADILDDHITYVRDLGLVSQTSPLEFANPIYAEIIPRIMASPIQESFPKEIQTPWFVNQDGNLEIEKLLKAFQKFYRRNSEAWLDRYEYKDSAQHLLFMSFLQRVINAKGEIIREMAVGNGRIDMLVKFGKQEFAFELKIKRGEYTLEDGKEQLDRYLDKLGLKKGYLVIFDPVDISWEQKLYWKEIIYNDKTIIMLGL